VPIADEPLHGILCRRRQHRIVARHDAVAKVLTTRLRSLPGVTVVEEPPAPTEALPGARADLKGEVKARKWLIDVAIVCPATKSVVARQNTHVHPGVSAKAGEAVKRKRYKGAVQGFVVEAGGRQEVHRRGGGGVRNVRGGEESSGEQDNEGDWDRSHAQAGHFGSRAEERGAVYGGFLRTA
jgi:hypothetical protein